MNVKIIVATHKKYWMPGDSMYVPLLLGADKKESEGFETDNSGENISALNPFFCELTGTYWAWKNLKADYIGLVHYRRHFSLHRYNKNIKEAILTYNELKPMLGSIKVFTPSKRHYIIESLSSHYSHTHEAEHLEVTRQVIGEKYPEYLGTYDEVLKRRWGYMFNMMVMERNLFESYCDWVFDILFELRQRLGDNGMSSFNRRYYGRIAEIIFNVWLEQKQREGLIKKSEIKELPVIKIDKTDWRKKIGAFLKAKYLHEKYERSY